MMEAAQRARSPRAPNREWSAGHPAAVAVAAERAGFPPAGLNPGGFEQASTLRGMGIMACERNKLGPMPLRRYRPVNNANERCK